MRIALVTCEEKPEGTADDRLLLQALLTHGHEAARESWSNVSTPWSNYDCALLRSPWDYYKKLPQFLAWAKKTTGQTRLLNSFETVRENAHKDYLLNLEMRGFPIVPSLIAESSQMAVAAATQILRKSPVILKPTVSGGSFLTYLVREEAEIAEAAQKILGHSELLLQPFLESISTDGEISLIYFRCGSEWTYSHSVLKTAATGEFRVQSDFNGKVESFEPSRKVKALAERILTQLSPQDSYVRIDLVDWKTNPKIGEIELIEPALFFAYGENAAALQIQSLEARLI